jgi:hypothetical protein
MTNDAKLGLVIGVAIVLVVGLLFFRQDPPAANAAINRPPSPTAHIDPR